MTRLARPIGQEETIGQARVRWRAHPQDLDHDTSVPPERWRTRCARCGSDDRLRQFWTIDDIWTPRHRFPAALCYRCDNLHLAFGGRPRPGLRARLDRIANWFAERRP